MIISMCCGDRSSIKIKPMVLLIHMWHLWSLSNWWIYHRMLFNTHHFSSTCFL